MAKSKSFFGLRTGSTKTLTFQVNAGKQITKDRVEIVKNPRTLSQMVQRMLMATVTAAYSAFRTICDHSFEGISYGANSMAEFVALNLKAIRQDYINGLAQFSYNPYRDRSLYPSPFILSKGSLQYDQSRLLVSAEQSTLLLTISTPQVDYHNQSVADLGNMLGLQLGDLLTIPFVYKDSVENVWKFAYVRLRYVATTDAMIDSVQLSDYFSVVASEGTPQVDVSSGSFDIQVSGISYGLNEVYGTIILSRKAASGWLRSSAALLFPSDPVNTPDAATALATYPVGDDYVLNGGSFSGGSVQPEPEPVPALYKVTNNGKDWLVDERGRYVNQQSGVYWFPSYFVESGSNKFWTGDNSNTPTDYEQKGSVNLLSGYSPITYGEYTISYAGAGYKIVPDVPVAS